MARKKNLETSLSVSVDTENNEPNTDIEGLETKEELEAPPIGFKSRTRHVTYPVSVLLQMYRSGHFILPIFQRKFVWSRKRRQGFLESLVLGVPTTSLMMAIDADTQDRHILDGFQRIQTLDLFCNDKEKMGPNLEDISKKKFSKLPRDVQNKLLATEFVVIEVEAERHYWPYIFGQINKGGVSLNPTEIRRATFMHSAMLELDTITETDKVWKVILFGPNVRYRGLQAALRALAMHVNYANYQKPMNKFMNAFCAERLESLDGEEVKLKFLHVIESLQNSLGRMAFRVTEGRGVNLGLIDCLIHAGFSILEAKWDVDSDTLGYVLKEIRETLITNNPDSFKGDTSKAESVMTRMKATDELVSIAVKQLKEQV